MRIKEIIFSILAIFLIFLIFLVASESKKAGKNEIKIEQLKDQSAQKDAAINNEKQTNETQQRQKKIISILDIDDDYVDKFLRWIWAE